MKDRINPPESQRFISASEISHYIFCNVSWYLDREGAPRNPGSGVRMQKGVRSHSTLKKRYNAVRIATYIVVTLILVIIGYLFTTMY